MIAVVGNEIEIESENEIEMDCRGVNSVNVPSSSSGS